MPRRFSNHARVISILIAGILLVEPARSVLFESELYFKHFDAEAGFMCSLESSYHSGASIACIKDQTIGLDLRSVVLKERVWEYTVNGGKVFVRRIPFYDGFVIEAYSELFQGKAVTKVNYDPL